MCGGASPGETDEDAVAFVLPPAYRPRGLSVYVNPTASASQILVVGVDAIGEHGVILAPGSVLIGGTPGSASGFLDSISFRAAGAGTGLPAKPGQTTLINGSLFDLIRGD